MASEAEIQAQSMLAVGSQPDVRLFRNTVGFGFQGQVIAKDRGTVRLERGDVVLRNARPVTFGLCPGSSDVVGWRTVVITPDMVGVRFAQFGVTEFKTETGRPSKEQERFLAAVQKAGGLADIVRSPIEMKTLWLRK